MSFRSAMRKFLFFTSVQLIALILCAFRRKLIFINALSFECDLSHKIELACFEYMCMIGTVIRIFTIAYFQLWILSPDCIIPSKVHVLEKSGFYWIRLESIWCDGIQSKQNRPIGITMLLRQSFAQLSQWKIAVNDMHSVVSSMNNKVQWRSQFKTIETNDIHLISIVLIDIYPVELNPL